jgi:transcriptional regulator with XRE-family HTH domain
MRAQRQAKRQGTKYKPLTRLAKKLLKQRRNELELTVEALAKKLKVSRKKVEDYETLRNYGCYIDIEDAAIWAKALDVPISYFFNEKNLAP